MAESGKVIDVFLQLGEYFVGDPGYRIRTILGSCVSITLWHPRLRIGAMSHFVLASRGSAPAEQLDGRYGEEVLCLMIGELQRAGAPLTEYQGKIFGGGNMFPGHARRHGKHVGRKNGEAARSLLASYGIPIVSESLFGEGHRQVIFDVRTGYVWSRQIKPATRPGTATS
jgi:chemotaxis protein CheD